MALIPAFLASVGAQAGGALTGGVALATPGAVRRRDYGIVIAVGGAAAGTISGPAGWTTLFASTQFGPTTGMMAIFGKAYEPGDADPVVTWPSAPGSGNNVSVLGVWYADVGGVGVIGSVDAGGAAQTTSPCPAITTGGANHRVLAIAATRGSAGFASSASWSGGATFRAARYATAAYYPSVSVADMLLAAAGATGVQTATWDFSSASRFGVQFALLPVPASTAVLPDLVVSNAGGWSVVGGSADLAVACSDNSDATYAESPAAPTNATFYLQTQGTLAPGSASMKIRLSKADNSSTGTVKVALCNAAGTPVAAEQTYTVTTSPADYAYTLSGAESSALTGRDNLQWRIIGTA